MAHHGYKSTDAAVLMYNRQVIDVNHHAASLRVHPHPTHPCPLIKCARLLWHHRLLVGDRDPQQLLLLYAAAAPAPPLSQCISRQQVFQVDRTLPSPVLLKQTASGRKNMLLEDAGHHSIACLCCSGCQPANKEL
jgi:hypothetical protein